MNNIKQLIEQAAVSHYESLDPTTPRSFTVRKTVMATGQQKHKKVVLMFGMKTIQDGQRT